MTSDTSISHPTAQHAEPGGPAPQPQAIDWAARVHEYPDLTHTLTSGAGAKGSIPTPDSGFDCPPTGTLTATAALPWLTFQSPDYFSSYELATDAILMGDCHFTRGDITVLGGVPGCGKSRLAMSIAIAGMRGPGTTWMGLPVHAHFKTAILQAENGEVRLKRELDEIKSLGHDLQRWLSITPPPRFGLAFNSPDFRHQLRDWLAEHKPGIFVVDPWNRCVVDDKAKDYRACLDQVMECLPDGPEKPNVTLLHHLRKRASGESRRRGRDLLNELSGSYVIGSTCRVAFFLEPATPDPTDDRVIFTCAKNNNGEEGPSTAWHRKNGLFVPCADFDWEEWENDGPVKRKSVELEDVAAVFENGAKMLSRVEAVKALEARCELKRAAVYAALKPGGRFDEWLSEAAGFLNFKP